MVQSAQAQLSGASLISPAQFPPWGAMSLPALTGWTPNASTGALPGFSVWPSAFNTIGAQAAFASLSAAQALGTLGS